MTAAALMACAVPAAAHDPNCVGRPVPLARRRRSLAVRRCRPVRRCGAGVAVSPSRRESSALRHRHTFAALVATRGATGWPKRRDLFQGPTLAVSLRGRRQRRLGDHAGGCLRPSGDAAWHAQRRARRSDPGPALAPGSRPGRVYLLGARGIYASSDRRAHVHPDRQPRSARRCRARAVRWCPGRRKHCSPYSRGESGRVTIRVNHMVARAIPARPGADRDARRRSRDRRGRAVGRFERPGACQR